MDGSPRTSDVTRAASRSKRAGALALVFGVAVAARAADVKGRLQLTDVYASSHDDSLDAALGHETRNDVSGDGRLMYEPSWGRWSFAFAYEITAVYGGGVALTKERSAFLPEPTPATMFDWTDTIADRGMTVAAQKIDRLVFGYAADRFVVRVGRQALTWGAGVMFHPMDLVDPFAPDTIDTEYKPGSDMVYAQWLFGDGSDLQAVAVPRPVRIGGPACSNASTFALHYRATFGTIGTTWLLSRDHGDWTGAGAVSGPLRGAVWNVELVPTLEPGSAWRISALANVTSAATLASRNATWFAEYYRNGFGVGERGVAIDALPPDLTDRLLRGQVFTTSRDYLTGGMRWELTPLVAFSPSLIANLDDASLYAAAVADWSVNDNGDLIFGTQIPAGPKRTEYGGLPLTDDAPPFVAAPTIVYVQYRQHF
jgi:hypothetical protein